MPKTISMTLVLAALVSLVGGGCDSPRRDLAATTTEQRYVASLDNIVQRLPGDDSFLFQVGFRDWQSEDQFDDLIYGSDLHPDVKQVRIYLPNVFGGYYVNILGSNLSTSDIQAQLTKNIEQWGKGRGVAAELAEVQKKNYKIGALRIEAPASAVQSWWQANTSTVRYVQVMRNDMERTQELYLPGEEIK